MSSKDLPRIYTDGSCLKNPGGASGWGFTLLENGEQWSCVGNNPSSTNNRMELQAVIEALLFAQSDEYVLYTDSQLTLKCATGVWGRKANKDLWAEYDNALRGRKIHWVWVKAHNGDKYNEIVDDLARNEAELLRNRKTVKK
jgi:ribonuclease HI